MSHRHLLDISKRATVMKLSRMDLIIIQALLLILAFFGTRTVKAESWNLQHPKGRFDDAATCPEVNQEELDLFLKDRDQVLESRSTRDDDDPDDPCSPKLCNATFHHSFSVPVTLPCSTASGEFPSTPHLPIIYPGDYDQCNRVFGFAGAHYCTIETSEFLGIPLRRSLVNYTGEGLLLGRLHLGQCVRKECTAALLRKWFLKRVRETAKKVRRRLPLDLTIPFLEQRILNTTQVRCVDEDEEKRGSVWDYPGSAAMAVVSLVLIAIVSCATVYDLALTSGGRTGSLAADLFVSVSARRSLVSLVKPMTGDFLVLNGIRVISMAWVIFGHVVLFSFGYVTPFPVLNLTEVDHQLQSFYIMLSRAAEYSVDTFFFMGGFLACFGTILDEISRGNLDGRFSFATYWRNLVLRYTRLTPVYVFTMFAYMKLMPFMGSGPFYEAAQGIAVKEAECRYWWTNILYLNDLVPYGPEGGLKGCVGWSWYLANDMQFFLLVLPCVCVYLKTQGRWVSYLPPVALIVIQLASTWWTMTAYDIRGSFDTDYNAYLYVKPWCRVSPYAVGIIFALWHHSRLAQKKQWKLSSHLFHGLPPFLVALIAFALLLVIGFAPYYQLRCEADDPKTDCNVFGGFIVYGAVVAKNWSHGEVTAYFVLTYLGWGIAVGLVFMYLFSGRGGVVHSLFSMQSLVPLARLSYSVYLVHIPIIQYMFTTSTRPLYVSKQSQLTMTVAVVVVAYVVSLLLYLVVERPAMSVISILLRRLGIVAPPEQAAPPSSSSSSSTMTGSSSAATSTSGGSSEDLNRGGEAIASDGQLRQPLLVRGSH